MRKKLQVFVSSTYTDLKEERQAAVQAILDAGHIPAGMELFKAGNESQLNTIYKWIDECDVYMLILGGRYGSIESKSGKSYTQLEYEYAISKGIPVFAVVLSEKFLVLKINELGLDVVEKENPDKSNEFKKFVMTKIVREVEDVKDIKLAVHSTLNEFLSDYDLTGWVKGNIEDNTITLLNENKELLKENLKLTNQVQKFNKQAKNVASDTIGNYKYKDVLKTLKAKYFLFEKGLEAYIANDLNALEIFLQYYDKFCTGIANAKGSMSQLDKIIFFYCAPYYMGFGLLEKVKLPKNIQRIQTSKLGMEFYARLQLDNINKQ